jgi:hypothetical protein
MKEIIVKAGEVLSIKVPFQSSPKPQVSWSKVKERIFICEDYIFIIINFKNETNLGRRGFAKEQAPRCFTKK